MRVLLPALLGVCAVCSLTLRDVARYALSRNLYSHVLIVPLIYLALVYRKRKEPVPRKEPSPALSLSFLVISLSALLLSHIPAFGITATDALSLRVFAFVTLVFAAVTLSLGRAGLARFCFPLFFLFFMVPMPEFVEKWFEACLQEGTAAVLPSLFFISGTPFIKDGMAFAIPGLTIEVTRECSGIRSSLVLLITGVLMGHVLLRAPWRKAIVAGMFYPIGILRNAFRILTVSLLSIHVDPSIIHGPLHRSGGPLFFGLSLIPFFLVLWWLVRTEDRSTAVERMHGEDTE